MKPQAKLAISTRDWLLLLLLLFVLPPQTSDAVWSFQNLHKISLAPARDRTDLSPSFFCVKCLANIMVELGFQSQNKILFFWVKILAASADPVGCLWLKTTFHYLSWFCESGIQTEVGWQFFYLVCQWLTRVAHYFHRRAVFLWRIQGFVQMPDTLAGTPGKLGSAKKKISSPCGLRADLHIFVCFPHGKDGVLPWRLSLCPLWILFWHRSCFECLRSKHLGTSKLYSVKFVMLFDFFVCLFCVQRHHL